MSEIKDVKEVMDANGNFEALDFYHQLTDSSGHITYVRFRYYEKELPALANSLRQYPQAKTWKNVVGLQEEVNVAPKPAGNYMHIAARKASISNVSQNVSSTSSTSSHTPKRAGISTQFGGKRANKLSSAPKPSLFLEDDEFDDWEDDSDDE